MMPDETVEYTTVHLEPIVSSDVIKVFEHHSADPRVPYTRYYGHPEERPRSEGNGSEGWQRPWHI